MTMSYGSDNPSGMGGMPSSSGLTLNPSREMGYAASKMRRKAIANALRSENAKHGLIHSPHIQHPRNGRVAAQSFSPNGAFRAGGF